MNKELNKCNIPIELLSAYIDNELNAEEQKNIEEHLKSCSICGKIVEEFKEIDSRIREMEVEEPSQEFIFNLKRNVMERIGKRKKWLFWRYTPVLVPVAVAVFVIIIARSEILSAPVGMKNRVAYIQSSEEIGEEAELMDVVLPESYTPVVSKPRAQIQQVKSEPSYAKKTDIDKATKEEIATSASAPDLIQESEIEDGVVIRAIIDSTGRVINVAKGKSLLPEEDTTVSQLLKGKKLSPPKIQGKPTQMFVEFSPGRKDSN